MSNDLLDNLIDDTARELSAGPVPPALRQRVRSGVQGLPPRRLWVAAAVWRPALGVAVLVAIGYLATRPPAAPLPPRPAAVVAEAPAAVEPGASSDAGAAAVLAPVAVQRRTGPAPVTIVAPPGDLPIEPLLVAPIPAMEAGVEEMRPEPLGIDDLEIRPLSGE